MMRKHAFSISIAVTALVCVLLLASVMLAQANGRPDPLTWYTVEQGVASGGGYHLTSLAWQVSGTASGAGYRLLGPASPTLRGPWGGCCCTWLPCVVRNRQ